MKINMKDIDPKQLKMGIEVEKEHDGEMGKDVDVVKSRDDLKKIAIAHLREDPKYYTKLRKMEKQSECFNFSSWLEKNYPYQSAFAGRNKDVSQTW